MVLAQASHKGVSIEGVTIAGGSKMAHRRLASWCWLWGGGLTIARGSWWCEGWLPGRKRPKREQGSDHMSFLTTLEITHLLFLLYSTSAVLYWSKRPALYNMGGNYPRELHGGDAGEGELLGPSWSLSHMTLGFNRKVCPAPLVWSVLDGMWEYCHNLCVHACWEPTTLKFLAWLSKTFRDLFWKCHSHFRFSYSKIKPIPISY